MRLIDADALVYSRVRIFYGLMDDGTPMVGGFNAVVMSCAIREAPTVDAAPVVHGHWIFGTANHREYMKCSVCLKSQTLTGVFTYCPNCGAKMDGGNEDDL